MVSNIELAIIKTAQLLFPITTTKAVIPFFSVAKLENFRVQVFNKHTGKILSNFVRKTGTLMFVAVRYLYLAWQYFLLKMFPTFQASPVFGCLIAKMSF